MTPGEARAILGVSRTSTVDDVKEAYRLRSRMMHPDRYADRPDSEVRLATSEFQRLGWARDVLVEATGREGSRSDQSHRAKAAETMTIRVDSSVLRLGGRVRFQTPLGVPATIAIPHASRNGLRLRLSDRSSTGGELIVIVLAGSEARSSNSNTSERPTGEGHWAGGAPPSQSDEVNQASKGPLGIGGGGWAAIWLLVVAAVVVAVWNHSAYLAGY